MKVSLKMMRSTKEKFLKEVEKAIRRKIPEGEIFMQPDLLDCFENFHDFESEGFEDVKI